MEKDQQFVRSVWPEWELTDLIGSGHLGMVYKARRRGGIEDTFSAIKIVTFGSGPEIAADSVDADCFLAGTVRNYVGEIQQLRCLGRCSNIVEIQDFSVYSNSGGHLWNALIRMELLKNLYDDLDGRKITDRLIIRIGEDLCRALEVCSTEHIAHLDIKPTKVYVNDNGEYKLCFALSKQMMDCTSGSVIMASRFMAPEVINKPLDADDFDQAHLADIYSLSTLLYWIANDMRLPFLEQRNLHTIKEYENAFQRKMNGEDPPPPMSVSVPLQKAILKGCMYDPLKRYSSAKEFGEALERISLQEESSAN